MSTLVFIVLLSICIYGYNHLPKSYKGKQRQEMKENCIMLGVFSVIMMIITMI